MWLAPVRVSASLNTVRGFSQTASLSSGHRHQASLTSLAPDADCKNKNSAPKVISLSKGVQSNFTQGECLRLEIVFFIVLFSNRSRKGERRDGGKEGKRNGDR